MITIDLKLNKVIYLIYKVQRLEFAEQMLNFSYKLLTYKTTTNSAMCNLLGNLLHLYLIN